jgi:superfamily I DNA/RNA helicase
MGQTISNGKHLKVLAAPGKPPYRYAATCVANALTWNSSDDVAIITPARSRFVTSIVELVSKEKFGKEKKVGPFPVSWEESHSELAAQAMGKLPLPHDAEAKGTLEVIAADESHPAVMMCYGSLARYRSLTGCKSLPRAVVAQHMEQAFLQHRRFAHHRSKRVRAMTVQQAKNREFAGVIVIWPYEIGSAKDEQKRRLLYNAITRAKEWCTVIAQDNKMLNRCPFLRPSRSS